MKLFLIRHGRTAWNREEVFRGTADVPLDDVGRKEAKFLARRLKEEALRVIYTSPLSRARETAEIIASECGTAVEVSEGLLDLDFGLWQGLSVEEVKGRFGDLYQRWMEAPHEVSFPGGEDLEAVRERAMGMVEDLKGRHRGEVVALVTHRVVLKVLICSLLGLGLDAFWRVAQGTAALNAFEWKGNCWVVRLLNDTCHLRSLKGEGGLEF